MGEGFPIHGQMPEMVAYGMTPGQEALLLLLQTLLTFWTEWILTLTILIYWISWLPEFQIFRFPDLTWLGLGLPLPARCACQELTVNILVSCIHVLCWMALVLAPLPTPKKLIDIPQGGVGCGSLARSNWSSNLAIGGTYGLGALARRLSFDVLYCNLVP